MLNLALVTTSPEFVPGSMPAYARLVVKALADRPGSCMQVRLCPFHHPDPKASIWRHHAWRLQHSRQVFESHPADLYHLLDGSMATFIPQRLQKNTVVTVHDLIPLMQLRKILPGKPSLPAARVIRGGVTALSKFAGVTAVSGCTRDDTAHLTGRDDIAVIPHPVRSFPPSEPVPVIDLDQPYLFHIGNDAAYKNRSAVLDVFAALQDGSRLRLVMSGAPPTSAMNRFVQQHRLPVTFTGPVTDGQLRTLYEHAALLLFPSRYEGFGMPVLEAMSLGCPVVCSTNGALDETAGRAALTAAADDLPALTAHCRALLTDPALRSGYVEKGRIHAEAHTLPDMGRMLCEWYQQVQDRLNGAGS